MAQADGETTPPQTSIPISEAANRVLQAYPAVIAGPRMKQGLADGQVHCSYRELVGHHVPEPTPDKPAFWKPDPRGQTQLTRFPWPGDWARRSVQPRGYRRPICAYVALGLMVAWEDVAAMFPAVAQVGPARVAAKEAAPSSKTGYQMVRTMRALQKLELLETKLSTAEVKRAVAKHLEKESRELSLSDPDWHTINRALGRE